MKRTAVSLAIALVLGGCGSANPPSAAPRPADAARALAGSPAPLRSLHQQAARLLDGGPAAFKARLASLQGHPVVVNKWASWCGPCRSEFPFFQRLAVDLGRRVGFLGVNSSDSAGDAARFLRKYPVRYPSYNDPHQKVAAVFGAILAFPTTAFYDAGGKLAFVHQGAYATAAKLRQDIARYAGG
ncbi:MAG: cytochrome c biosis protein CcmG, thiol:disulfide interchange protein DsbE [Thermoleophilaceae bacterium]|nr:cytochrome c biosis protein CcmG, thiol:disulfide interchange protein DsbE [Thermoleophilaceae bacterium]